MSSKKCNKCNLVKLYEEFSKQSSRKDGRRSYCKECIKDISVNRSIKEIELFREKRKEYNIKNAEKKRAYQKKYRKENIEVVSIKEKAYKIKNKDKVRVYKKEYAHKNAAKIKSSYREYYKKNNKKLKAYQRDYFKGNKNYVLSRNKKYYLKNKAKIMQVAKTYNRNRRLTNIYYKLRMNMSCAIWHGLRKNKLGKGWQTLVPYTIKELMTHLESNFTTGMTWENYGKSGWHVDHIIPQSYFKYDSYTHPAFKACWDLNNLQPLWAKDNISKSNRIKITPKIKKLLKLVNGGVTDGSNSVQ